MNSLEHALLDLVGIAETPLYSAFGWLRRRLRGQLSLRAFLDLINQLVERDALRLWLVDESGDRTEYFEVPSSLAERYSRLDLADESCDPLGLSLSLGAASDTGAEPDWEFDLPPDENTFVLRCPPTARENAFAVLAHLMPDLLLEPWSSDGDTPPEIRATRGDPGAAGLHPSADRAGRGTIPAQAAPREAPGGRPDQVVVVGGDGPARGVGPGDDRSAHRG